MASPTRPDRFVTAATTLFQDHGYRNVSMEQIGGAVGLTGPAVYRHFPSKQDILATALTTQVHTVRDFLSDAQDRGDTPVEQLGLFFDALSEMTAHRDASTLWNRERLHLSHADLDTMNAYFGVLTDKLACKICAARHDVDSMDAKLLATAALSVYSNAAQIRGSLTAKRLMKVQRAVTDSILGCELPRAPGPPVAQASHSRRSPAARRERILDAATQLFFDRGFRDVRIDEIAARAGVSVTTVYQEYAGKTVILGTVLRRGLEGLLSASIAALDGSSRTDALDVLLGTFIEFSLSSNGRILAVALRDAVYLPEESRIALGRTASDYTAEWTTAILAQTPGLSIDDAKALEKSLAGFACQVISSPELRSRPGIDSELRALAYGILSPSGLSRSHPRRSAH
ncbi:TetR/AcrR family transcriptional regulator [Gordonia terrae]